MIIVRWSQPHFKQIKIWNFNKPLISKGNSLCTWHYGPQGQGNWVPWSSPRGTDKLLFSKQMSSEFMTPAGPGLGCGQQGEAVIRWPMPFAELALAQPRKSQEGCH